LNTKTTIMTASVVVGAILVAGTLVLPYSYAMARHFGNFSFKSIDVRKSVDSIKQKVEAKPSAGSATGSSGGTANGGNSGASTGGNGGPANGVQQVLAALAAMAVPQMLTEALQPLQQGLAALAALAAAQPPALAALVPAVPAVLVALAQAAAPQLTLAVMVAILVQL
jgi:hypothetical protein